jgi:uncharacterized membrane protein YtjA (UPF0391 family)
MKTTSAVLVGLALVAAALGFWVLAGVAAFIIRLLALIFLVVAVLGLREQVVSKG